MPSGAITYLSDKDRLAKTMLDHDIRFQSMSMTQFRGLAKPIKKFGANKGQTVEIEKYHKLPKITSELSELATLPLQKPNITFTQITVKEYGGGVSYTYKASTIAEYSVDSSLRKELAINMTESLDQIAYNDGFGKSDVFWTPTGTASSPTGVFDKSGTISTVATRHIQAFDLRQVIARMKKDNIMKWDGNYYLGVFSPFAVMRLFEDTSASGIYETFKYDMPEVLVRGEIGTYAGLRMLEETNALSNTLGTTNYEGEAIICGFEPVVETLVEPEHIETERWDFNRFTGIAWLVLTGFAKLWTASTDNGEYRIVRIWST